MLSLTAIDCVWNDDWVSGQCSKTCGTGIQINTRTKRIVESNGGSCSGYNNETVTCRIQECPGNLRRYLNVPYEHSMQ